MNRDVKIYIAGHNGMVGSSICRKLKDKGYHNLVGKTSEELDLKNQSYVYEYIKSEKPDVVINAAAKVGGILANNDFPYQFIMENMQIQNNLIHGAFKNKIENFIFLGSSCIYPKFAKQPIKEEYLLSNFLEPTNEYYAIAKISGVKSCEAIRKQYGKYYLSLMPTNLYGYNDNFDFDSSHVLPAMIRKFHEAKKNNNKTVVLWGSGKPLRDFLFVDDMANAIIFALENKLPENIYNVGTGHDLSIKKLAEIIKNTIGYDGEISWDLKKPDGTPRKIMDVSRLNQLGWKHQTDLKDGVKKTYNWFLQNIKNFKEIKL